MPSKQSIPADLSKPAWRSYTRYVSIHTSRSIKASLDELYQVCINILRYVPLGCKIKFLCVSTKRFVLSQKLHESCSCSDSHNLCILITVIKYSSEECQKYFSFVWFTNDICQQIILNYLSVITVNMNTQCLFRHPIFDNINKIKERCFFENIFPVCHFHIHVYLDIVSCY